MQKSKVPTFASDGRRLRAYPLASIERFLALSLIVCKRNRKGEILAAHFRPSDGSNPLRATCNMGQRYSHLEHIGDDGARAWAHRPLIQRQDIEQLTGIPLDSPEDLDLYLRGIFRGVALSCMVSPVDGKPERTPPGKVVNIADAKKRIRTRRPVEFDSEQRTAEKHVA